jgi:tRNA1(Val) A37 N6-methylase TrmN6
MTGAADFEGLLRQALAPVEPPAYLANRLEQRLQTITEMAAEELDALELSAMRDPRNWARPVAAVVLGTGAGAALMVLRARRRTAEADGVERAHAAVRSSLKDAELQARRLLRLR